MKYWITTALLSVAWVGGNFGIMYLHTHAQNDALDQIYGQVAGFGVVLIWTCAIFWRFKKKSEQS